MTAMSSPRIPGVAPAAALASLLLCGCEPSDPVGGTPLRVVQVQPARPTIRLNEDLSIRFSQPVDPTTVTEDTVYVEDERGQRVAGSRSVSGHRIRFVPRSPLAADLGDGSFRPGQTYRLVAQGFPSASAVQSTDGQLLDQFGTWTFRAAAQDSVPSPMLPFDESPLGFAVDGDLLKLGTDSRTLEVYFYEPPLPTSVTTAAFELARGANQDPLRPTAARLRRAPRPYSTFPGWLVELEFETPPVTEAGYCGLRLRGGPGGLRDARGQSPQQVVWLDGEPELRPVVDRHLLVEVYSGRVPALEARFEQLAFRPLSPAALGFESLGGRAVPRVRGFAGTGALGVLAPTRDLVLAADANVDRGDGVLVEASAAGYEFAGVVIPKGVTVVLQGDGRRAPCLRAAGLVRIDGRLVVRGVPPTAWPERSIDAAPERVLERVSAAVVAGGEIIITGEVEFEYPVGDEEVGLALLAGGGIALGGRLPPGTMLVTEPDAGVVGAAGRAVRWSRMAALPSDVPDGMAMAAEAASEWLPLRGISLLTEVQTVAGAGVTLEVQLAPPDALNPSRPIDDERLLPREVRLPLREPLAVPKNGFVRLLLRAQVQAGAPVPWSGSVRFHGR